MNTKRNILFRTGNMAIFAVVVTGLSLLLTTVYTVNTRQSTSITAIAQTQPCSSRGATCCRRPSLNGMELYCTPEDKFLCDPATLQCDSRWGIKVPPKEEPSTNNPSGTTCDTVGSACCSTPESPLTGEKICRNNLQCVSGVCQQPASGGPGGGNTDEQYIGRSCSVGDGRSGTCQWASGDITCSGGSELVPGYCPGSSAVQCCVSKQAGGGTTPQQPGTQTPPQQPAQPVSVTIAGAITNQAKTKGVSGMQVTIGTLETASGARTETTVTTDFFGNYSHVVTLRAGDGYSVRPGAVPAGWTGTAGTSNTTHSRAAHLGDNTPAGTASYEQQVVGSTDCASNPGRAACDFVVAEAPAQTGQTNQPAQPANVKACLLKQAPPPIVDQPPQDISATEKKEMTIAIKLFLPTGPGGTIGPEPVEKSMSLDVLVTNAARVEDSESVTIPVTYKGNGLWEGSYVTQHYPGSQYSFTVWPKKFAKKTLCHIGTMSPHVIYSGSYSCSEAEGTIALQAGSNTLDFSAVKMGPGDLNTEETRDGLVDAQDLYRLVQYIRDPSRDQIDGADINMDGAINQADYDLAVWTIENVPE